MTRNQLDGLIGLNVKEAGSKVLDIGFVPRNLAKNQIITLGTIHPNIVHIRYDENNIVISAETQASIDAKY